MLLARGRRRRPRANNIINILSRFPGGNCKFVETAAGYGIIRIMNDSFIGSHVAHFRIERLLGRGGMASVYFAWDEKNDRAVALKVLDERNRDVPASVGRFIQEARTMANWDHPHIVRMLEAGESNGIYFYAMEFIRGLDLSQLLRQYLDANQLMPYADVLRLGWAVSEALDYAHKHGIIHRDVKPSNVLVSVDGRVLLSDFGLVMDIARGTLGETFGSPHYIAPEQARRSSEAVAQSDIYSMGIMLYEMLTGTVPFHDPSPVALAQKHLAENPPAPRMLNPRLSPAVEAVLMRALRKNPRERYATGRELMTALERSLTLEMTQAQSTAPLPVSPESQRLRSLRAAGLPFPAMEGQARPEPPLYQSNPTAIGGPTAAAGGLPPVPSSQVRPAAVLRGEPPASAAQTVRAGTPPPYNPQYSQPGYGPPPAYGGGGAAQPPARRRAGNWFGCAALVALFLVLAVGIGAAVALSGQGGFTLPGFPGAAPGNQATDTPEPGEPTDLPIPTLTHTIEPTITSTFEPTPSLTFTLEPTFTFTPEPTATATLAPTETPVPPTVLVIERSGNEGIVMVNEGPIPFSLALIEFWDNDHEMDGEEWEIEVLEPDQCVVVWEAGGRPRLPEGMECDPVGTVVERSGRMRFWTRTINVRYQDEEIASCRTNEQRCEITIP